MCYIDCHTHLNSSLYDNDRKKVLESASKSGIKSILNCATDFNDWDKTLQLSTEFDILKTALGVHPWYIPSDYDVSFDRINKNQFKNVYAVGEIGLDKKFSKIDMDCQKKVFSDFLKIAKDFNLPASVHCIGAFNELIEVIKAIGPLKKGIVIHAFNGSKELAESLFKYNIYFSIGGIITYMDSTRREEMIKTIYPERMLLETDSPDIPPAGKKNERNLPENIILIANAAACILNKPEKKIAQSTTELAQEIFGV